MTALEALEAAYNRGIADATDALRRASRAVPDNHGIGPQALITIADAIDELKIAGSTTAH